MELKQWKELYFEIDENYRSFLERWRKHDFRFPEQYEQNARIVMDFMEITHDVIFSREELSALLLEGMDYGQRYWMETVGLKVDTVYMRHIPILLHKMEQIIKDFEEVKN